MATKTPYLSLVLMNTGENVGTWGISLNQNFQTLDTIAGEVIDARGSNQNISERFSTVDKEMAGARGSFSNLNDRLSYLINADGTSRIENFSKATAQSFGVVRLSKASSDPSIPVVVENTDERLLTAQEKAALTGGAVTHIHKHYLSDIQDVTCTSAEISRALNGISGNVTAQNLNLLTSGQAVPKSVMTVPNAGYNYTGIVSLTAAPENSDAPLAVGSNDQRMLSQDEKDALTKGNQTTLHKHKLADGASDLTVTAVELNRLAGASTRVNATNLDVLTGGTNTTLHKHDDLYYPRAEADAAINVAEQRVTEKISNHSSSGEAHRDANLTLGRITAKNVLVTEQGGTLEVKAHASDAATSNKLIIKDQSGAIVASIAADGTVSAKKIVAETQEIKEVSTTKHKAVMTSQLEVQGNTTLGDDANTDILTVNAVTSTFGGSVNIAGALTVTGTVNGLDLAGINTKANSLETEITNARGTKSTLVENINDIKNTATREIEAIKAARNNPNQVTITQAVAADDGTNITVAELETLSDGSSADALHTHKKYDDIFNQVKTSSIYGGFQSLQARLEKIEQVSNGNTTELTNARNSEASVDARLDKMDTKNTEQDGRITNAQAKADSNLVKINGIDGKVAALEGQMSVANAGISTNKSDIASIRSEIGQVRSDVLAATNKASNSEGKISALESKTSTHETKISTIEKSLITKQLVENVNVAVSGTNVSESVANTTFTNVGVSVTIFDITTGTIIPHSDAEYVRVVLEGGTAKVKFKLKSGTTYATNSRKLNVLAIG